MSSTNVKVKASLARSETKPAMSKSASNMPTSGHRTDEAFTKASVAEDGNIATKASVASDEVKAKHAESAVRTLDDAGKKRPSTFDDMVKKAQPYLDKHGHAIGYGIVGIVAAVLILTIGFWPVLLLAIFAAIGIAIGKFRDSGASMQNAVRSLAEGIRR